MKTLLIDGSDLSLKEEIFIIDLQKRKGYSSIELLEDVQNIYREKQYISPRRKTRELVGEKSTELGSLLRIGIQRFIAYIKKDLK